MGVFVYPKNVCGRSAKYLILFSSITLVFYQTEDSNLLCWTEECQNNVSLSPGREQGERLKV